MYRYAEGAGTAARFEYLRNIDFLSSTELICTDRGNHCLRLVDFTLSPPTTSTFAGNCTVEGNSDGHRLNSALFQNPRRTEVNSNNLTLFVIDRDTSLLRIIDLSTDNVDTLITFDNSGMDMKLIGNSLLYIAQKTRVTVYKLDTRKKSKVAGGPSSGSATGSFGDTRFGYAVRLLLWREKEKVILLVLDYTSDRFAGFCYHVNV